jgi:Concanavalin A-like lectin/glucanases superfamily
MSDAPINSQIASSAPIPTGLTPVTAPLLPDQGVLAQMANFPPQTYNLDLGSSIVKLMSSLTGASGGGQLRQRSLMDRLRSSVSSTYFTDLDNSLGAVLGISRQLTEALPFNPYTTAAPSTGPQSWAAMAEADATYRDRLFQVLRAVSTYGPTAIGLQLVAESFLLAPCEVTEYYRGHPPSNITANPSLAYYITITPHVTPTPQQTYGLMKILNKIKPALATVTLAPAPTINPYLQVSIRDAWASSFYWEVQSISSAPSIYGSTTVPQYAFGSSQAAAWTTNGWVSGVVSYSQNPDGSLSTPSDFEQITWADGTITNYLPVYAMAPSSEAVLGTMVVPGNALANPINPDNSTVSDILLSGASISAIQAASTITAQTVPQFWSTPERAYTDMTQEVIEVRFSSPVNTNAVSFQVANFPCTALFQVYDDVNGAWVPYYQQTVVTSVPSVLPNPSDALAAKTHPQHFGPGHWVSVAFRFTPTSFSRARIVMFRPGPLGPQGPMSAMTGAPALYSLGVTEFSFDYVVDSASQLPDNGTVSLEPIGTSTDVAGNTITYSVYSEVPNVPDPGARMTAAQFGSLLATYSPYVWWKLTDRAGSSSVADSAGSHPGTIHGGVTLGQPGPLVGQTAARFDGSTGYVGTTVVTTGWTGISVLAWVYIASEPGASATIAANADTGSAAADTDNGFRLNFNASGQLCFAVGNGTAWAQAASAAGAVTAGAWHLVAGVWDLANVNLYLDGVLVASAPLAGSTVGTPTYVVQLGENPDTTGPQFFAGSLAEVAMFNSALSAAKMSALSAHPPGSLAQWRCFPQPVNNAVVCLYLDTRDSNGNPQTIDRFFVTPTHLGVGCTLYFAIEEPDTPGDMASLNWILVNRSYILMTGWMVVYPIAAKYWKFEMSGLVAEPLQNPFPVTTDILMFGPDAVNPTTGSAGYQGATPAGTTTQANMAAGDTVLTTPAVGTPPSGTYSAATALVAADPTLAQMLQSNFANYGYIDWQPFGAPPATLGGPEGYTTTTIASVNSVGFFTGFSSIVAYRTNPACPIDSPLYYEVFYDAMQIASANCQTVGGIYSGPGSTPAPDNNPQSELLAIPAVVTSSAYISASVVNKVQFATQQSPPAEVVPFDTFRNGRYLPQATGGYQWDDQQDWNIVAMGDVVVNFNAQTLNPVLSRGATTYTGPEANGLVSGPFLTSPVGWLTLAVRLSILSVPPINPEFFSQYPVYLQLCQWNGNDLAPTVLVEWPLPASAVGQTVEEYYSYQIGSTVSSDTFLCLAVAQHAGAYPPAGQTASWVVQAASAFDPSIMWEFSSDGANWVQAGSVNFVHNNINGVVSIPTPSTDLYWRVTLYRPDMFVNVLKIRPWYQETDRPRLAPVMSGPNMSFSDPDQTIWSDPFFSAMGSPVPLWWFAKYQQAALFPDGVPVITPSSKIYAQDVVETVGLLTTPPWSPTTWRCTTRSKRLARPSTQSRPTPLTTPVRPIPWARPPIPPPGSSPLLPPTPIRTTTQVGRRLGPPPRTSRGVRSPSPSTVAVGAGPPGASGARSALPCRWSRARSSTSSSGARERPTPTIPKAATPMATTRVGPCTTFTRTP